MLPGEEITELATRRSTKLSKTAVNISLSKYHKSAVLAVALALPASLVFAAEPTSFATSAGAAQRVASASASVGITVVIPPYCFELVGDALFDEVLRSALQARRVLCSVTTGTGIPRRIESTPEGLRIVPGKPNALHRGEI